ncbi:ImmA/IrrE family metallo-endopeptidase [Ferruginivarius sediminum]|uniref:ImmA/IrrE family metallo-endopeptidase n=1 Tax=Ferruginivarius sediminum TaxID=2661937 RepID=A0A369TC11_9PROT|nr:ImmA/IrrE family metallo-endopeptidase [Ferruginivarius sediminum]RDD60456.1 ImmA/IrrE family metallo-endopeptidase [Ferruginivarius sediminum]
MSSVSQLLNSLGVEASEVADKANIPVERAAQILEGASPTFAELRALAHGLGLPMEAFASGNAPSEKSKSLSVKFRTKPSAGKFHSNLEKENIANFVNSALSILPVQNELPDWLGRLSFKKETYSEAEQLAYNFRSMFLNEPWDEPVTHLPEILSNNCSIFLSKMKANSYEGASLIMNNNVFVFVSPRFPGRMLFTIAHELGHVIAHHKYGGPAIFDSEENLYGWRKISKSEKFVDIFASILLLPERGVARALKKIRQSYNIHSSQIGDIEILVLARFFGVSFEVAARRLERLDLLPKGGATSLRDELYRKHGSPEKRAESAGLPARVLVDIPKVSDNLLRHIVKAIELGDISTGWACDNFGVAITDINDAHSRFSGELRH